MHQFCKRATLPQIGVTALSVHLHPLLITSQPLAIKFIGSSRSPFASRFPIVIVVHLTIQH